MKFPRSLQITRTVTKLSLCNRKIPSTNYEIFQNPNEALNEHPKRTTARCHDTRMNENVEIGKEIRAERRAEELLPTLSFSHVE